MCILAGILPESLSVVVLKPAPTLRTIRSALSHQMCAGMCKCIIFRARGNTGANFSGPLLNVFFHISEMAAGTYCSS